MKNQQIVIALCGVGLSMLGYLTLDAYHLTVTNFTPFTIKVRCKTKGGGGVCKNDWKEINPNEKKEIGCACAFLVSGIEAKIYAAKAGLKDFEFSNEWPAQARNLDAAVVAIPKLVKELGDFDPDTHTQSVTYSIKSFKIAIVRDLEIEKNEIIPFGCEAE